MLATARQLGRRLQQAAAAVETAARRRRPGAEADLDALQRFVLSKLADRTAQVSERRLYAPKM